MHCSQQKLLPTTLLIGTDVVWRAGLYRSMQKSNYYSTSNATYVVTNSSVAGMKQMHQLLPAGFRRPLFKTVQISVFFWEIGFKKRGLNCSLANPMHQAFWTSPPSYMTPLSRDTLLISAFGRNWFQLPETHFVRRCVTSLGLSCSLHHWVNMYNNVLCFLVEGEGAIQIMQVTVIYWRDVLSADL